jgi:hypothetical protein
LSDVVVPAGAAYPSKEPSMSFVSRSRLSPRPVHGVAAALLLVVAMLAAGFGAAFAAPTTPPSLVVTASTDNTALTGAPTGAIPGVLAAKGSTSITITVSLSDGTELSRGLVLDLAPVRQDGKKPAGSFSPSSYTVPVKGVSTVFTVTYSAAEDGIALKATVRKANSTSPTPGQTAFFDVLESLRVTPKNQVPTDGFGADTCNTSSNVSVCGVVYLARGITSAAAALSSGVCSDTGCSGGKEVQFIAGLSDANGDLYSRSNPAILSLQCDKSRCGGMGVSSYTAYASLSATGALTAVPACESKGVIQAGADFCTDYVSSHRDNAGDVILQVLFFRDMRGTM